MNVCTMCPRNCKIDRTNKNGFCGVTNNIKVAKACLHFWEEPIISGKNGSGTIFFSGCNLKCKFCQNFEISHNCFGQEITIEKLVEIIKNLEKKGAENINLVSPSQFSFQIIEALKIYKPKIPVVWNSNGYEKVETIEYISPYVDIFLVDFKYMDCDLSQRLSFAKDYSLVAKKCVQKMAELMPNNVYENNLLKKGLIIRHLVLPNHIEDSKNVLKYVSENYPNAVISVMSQYTPYFKANEEKDINRKLKPLEYKIILNYIDKLNIKNGFVQELTSSSTNYIPIFDLEGIK